ncbi:hypothetical protein SAMN04515671_2976 [Nakamurella panacisegetis]|uniref:Septum formation n=1 Tax=Nakamurella panacisegetis TaxID=1090615 RepID=A0A1H0Q371_9ACTN|nr:hypothetical protein SAMN04515671_2976 [Nakamurella panacisegetis]
MGFLLMVAALIGVLAGHSLIRTDLAGHAVGLDVPGAPKVGDCVLSVAPPDFDTPITTAVFGSCRGVVAGEVASVRAGAAPEIDDSVGSLMGTAGSCWADASRYIGLPVVDGSAALPAGFLPTSVVAWEPELQVRGQRIRADALQRATGRDWTACLVRPQDLHVYLGTVRAALERGAAPAEYADCATVLGQGWSASVPCSQPHLTEHLGSAMVATGSVSHSALQNSCSAFAARLLQVPDPTYGGQLQVTAVTGNVTTCDINSIGDARLVGSLIGLAGRPIPYVN